MRLYSKLAIQKPDLPAALPQTTAAARDRQREQSAADPVAIPNLLRVSSPPGNGPATIPPPIIIGMYHNSAGTSQ